MRYRKIRKQLESMEVTFLIIDLLILLHFSTISIDVLTSIYVSYHMDILIIYLFICFVNLFRI